MLKKKKTQSNTPPDPEFQPRAEESLGQYMRRLRLMRGMSLPDVARFTSHLPAERRVSHPYLSQIELGQVFRPAPERLRSIARVLQVPPEWLLEKAGIDEDGVVESSNQTASPLVEQIAFRAARLDPADQKMFLEMIDAIVKMKLGKGKNKRTAKKE